MGAAVTAAAAAITLATPSLLPGDAPRAASATSPPSGSIIGLTPTSITETGATLRANVLTAFAGSLVAFEYGPTTSYGMVSQKVRVDLLGSLAQVNVPIDGLVSNTTYHARPYVQIGPIRITANTDTVFTTARRVTDTTGVADTTTGLLDPHAGPSPTTMPSEAPAPTDDATATQPAATSPTAAPTVTAVPAPVPNASVVVAPLQGDVRIRTGNAPYHPLSDTTRIPLGAIVDARHGRIELTAARDRSGALQSGRFWAGVFSVRQNRTTHGRTELVLRGGRFADCPRRTPTATAHAAKRRRPPRRLWGSDSGGRFQTRGRGSVATVRGTRWLTEDLCAGTRTTVVQGAVSVRDLRTGRRTLVRAGHTHLARLGRR